MKKNMTIDQDTPVGIIVISHILTMLPLAYALYILVTSYTGILEMPKDEYKKYALVERVKFRIS